jgi:hypothetical protein
MDSAAGVEDVTAGLKAKQDELFKSLKKKDDEMAELRSKLEDQEAARKAEQAGVDPTEVDRLANERAEAKFRALEEGWKGQTAKTEKALKTAESDRDFLVERLMSTALDLQIHKVAPDTAGELWDYVRDQKVRPHVEPVANGEGEWWREKALSFKVVDPQTKTPLPFETVGALVAEKRKSDWAACFPPTGKGGGITTPAGAPSGTLGPDASASQLIGSIFD